MSRPELTARERAVLDFERDWPAHAGGKLESIRATFGFSPTRYYQLIAGLLDRDAAMKYDPLLMRRLQKRRNNRTERSVTLGLTDQRGRGLRQ
ncbi:MAG: DUF3263 domain-containing protein [Euzebya sp.]